MSMLPGEEETGLEQGLQRPLLPLGGCLTVSGDNAFGFPLCCLPIIPNLFAILKKKYLDSPIYLIGLYTILNNFSQMKNVIPCNISLGFLRVLGCTNSMKKHTWKQIQLISLTVQFSCSLVSDSL